MQNKVTQTVPRLFTALITFIILCLQWSSPQVNAATLTINNCTAAELQATIASANSGDIIIFGCTGTIAFTNAITVDKSIAIDGGGNITFDGGNTTKHFTIAAAGNLTLTNLTLQNGAAPAAPGEEDGGSVNNAGIFVATNSTFRDNSANNIGGDGGAINNLGGDVTIIGSTFTGNIAQNSGAVNNAGTMRIENSLFVNNIASAFAGGAVGNNVGFTLSVVNSRFEGNFAAATTFDGGAIYNGGYITVTGAKLTGNTGANGTGGGLYNAAVGTGTVSNSCLVGNSVSFVQNSTNAFTLSNNWWGRTSGPSIDFPGEGDGFINLSGATVAGPTPLTLPNLPTFGCPTVVTDFYTIPIGQTLDVAAEDGLLVNDIGVQANTATVDTPPDFGSLTLSADGAFTYTPDTPTEPVDGFRYRALDLDGAPFIGLVCITRTNLQVTVPPTQTTTVNTPIPIPNLSVQGAAPQTQVRVDLRVNLGTIDTGFANTGAATIPPSQECSDLLEEIRTASVTQAPSVVSNGTSATPELMRYSSSRSFVPYFQQQPPPGVTIQGNGTNNVIIEGPLSGVNTVLASVTYVSPTVGVDNLVIVANDGAGSVATGQVVIIINGGAPPPSGGSGGSGGDDSTVSGGSGDSDTTVAIAAPLGPLTLFEISQIPGSVVRGESSTSTVQNGDVFVRVIATNGTLQVGTEQIGDPTLLQLPIFNGAEVFGLTFGGVPVQDFGGRVKLCLLGVGTFYYRDATAMPRTTVILPTTLENGFTCALIPNAGTVILVADGTNTVPPAPETVNIAERRTLPPGCMVTTDAIINLRETPSIADNIIRRVPFNVTLTAFEQDGNWYFVDYLGQRGWMSADFVTPNQRC